MDFLVDIIMWTLSIFGLYEVIIKLMDLYMSRKYEKDKINMILLVKNQEENIEAILRKIKIKNLEGQSNLLTNLKIVDLNSKDNTFKIAQKIFSDFEEKRVITWQECKEKFDNIDKM